MKKYIIVEADTNDGDYITEKSIITDEKIIKLKEILNKCEIDSWGRGDMKDDDNDPKILYPELTGEEIEFIEDFLPFGEYGIHTIESIEILEISNEERLL